MEWSAIGHWVLPWDLLFGRRAGLHSSSINIPLCPTTSEFEQGILRSSCFTVITASSSTPQRLVSLPPWPPHSFAMFYRLSLPCLWYVNIGSIIQKEGNFAKAETFVVDSA